MPVMAKLSRKFYDTFGEDIANELVEWFNQVDATYRADLRELNELNFQRFDAKLEQRIGEVRGEIRQLGTELRAEMKQNVGVLEAKLDRGLAEVRADMGLLGSQLDKRLAELRAELIRRMFLFWVGTVVSVGGLVVALTR